VRDVAHGTQVRVRGSRETAGCPVTACHCLPLLLSVENVTTKPTDRHTVRRRALRGEREARLAGKDRTGPGARGQIRLYGRCNIKQSGAWPYCSVACQSTPRGTAPAGAASPCDWLTSPLCVLLLVPPSVALPATKPARMQDQGPGSAKRAGAAPSERWGQGCEVPRGERLCYHSSPGLSCSYFYIRHCRIVVQPSCELLSSCVMYTQR
jgi:hypothetical protein